MSVRLWCGSQHSVCPRTTSWCVRVRTGGCVCGCGCVCGTGPMVALAPVCRQVRHSVRNVHPWAPGPLHLPGLPHVEPAWGLWTRESSWGTRGGARGACVGGSAPGPTTLQGRAVPPRAWSQVTGTCAESGGDNNHQGMFEFPPGTNSWYFAYHNRKLARSRGEYGTPCAQAYSLSWEGFVWWRTPLSPFSAALFFVPTRGGGSGGGDGDGVHLSVRCCVPWTSQIPWVPAQRGAGSSVRRWWAQHVPLALACAWDAGTRHQHTLLPQAAVVGAHVVCVLRACVQERQ